MKGLLAGYRAGWLLLAGLSFAPHVAKAQLIMQYFPSDLPGYSPDSTGSVSLRSIIAHRHAGVRVGSFLLRPSASQQVGYNTNILGAPHTGSALLTTAASLSATSDWSRHALGASLSVNNQAYTSLSAANYTDWAAAAGGSVNLGRDVLSLGYSHAVKHLSATDLGNFGIGYPVPYTTDDVRLGYRKNWARFVLIPSASYDYFSFGRSAGTRSTASRDTTSLSHQLEMQMLQGRFEFSQGNALVVILRGSEAQFRAGQNIVPTDYVSGGGFVGVDLRSDSLLQYRLLVGGEHRQFTRGGGRAAQTPTAEADVLWMPDRLDTVTLTGQRGFFDPTSPFARNQIVSLVTLNWDRELRRDLVFHGIVSLSRSDASSSTPGTPTRVQNQTRFNGSLDWQFSRDMKMTLQYSHVSSYSKHGVAAVIANERAKATFTGNIFSFGLSYAR